MDAARNTSSESIYLGTDVRCVRHLHSHTGVLHSTQSWQHLLACAEWCPDTQEESIGIYHVDIDCRGGAAAPAPSNCGVLNSFGMRHATNGLQTMDMGQGEGMIVAGDSRGDLYRVFYKLPQKPYTAAEEIQWDTTSTAEGEGGFLPRWLQAHDGSVCGLDINADTNQVVSTGRDGGISLAGPSAVNTADTFRCPQPASTYAAVKWASLKTFVTVGPTGALETWDLRQGGSSAASRLTLQHHQNGYSVKDMAFNMTCLDINSSRPDFCVTGGLNGLICLWDLRSLVAPVAQTSLPVFGNSTEVRFQPLEEQSTSPSVLSTTSNGFLLSISIGGKGFSGETPVSGKNTNGTETLVSAEHGLTSLSFDPLLSEDIICCCSSESLVYVHRA